MNAIDTHGLTVFKLVKFIEVEGLTSIGWRLLGTVNRSSIATVFEAEPVPTLSPSNGMYQPPQTMQINRHHVVDDPLFLLGRDDESALAVMKANLDAAKAVVLEHASCSGVLKISQSEVERTKQTKEVWESQSRQLEKNLSKAVEGSRQMEQDIAKLRTALGEVRMKEILGS